MRVRRFALLLTAAMLGCFGAPTAARAHVEALAEEPVIPGLDVAVDFQVAPGGDVYVAHQDGRIVRYQRAAGSTAAHPLYDLRGELIYDFPVTRQFDRGLVGIAVDAQFDSGHRYVYAVITRGSNEWVGNLPNGNPNGIRRTGAVIRIAVPATGPATSADLTTIAGAGAPADPDSTCKPFMAGQAPPGETDALPNGVKRRINEGKPPQVSLFADFTEDHVFPDGDLGTRTDGAYDCIPSDSDTHGMGAIASAPDGTLFFSVGDASAYDVTDPASLRAYNLESYAGKILHIDRSGRGVDGHPFCPGEADTTRICTKVWVRGLRNAFRFSLLPPDGASGGAPVLAVGDVGNFSRERLTIAHPGDNLGWPCWEGTYWAVSYSSPENSSAVKSAWGGPEFTPAGAGHTSCERSTATGDGHGFPAAQGITFPTLEYNHDQQSEPPVPYNGAAIIAGGLLAPTPGADAEVALPSDWQGSFLFGDYVRGWLYRLARDTSDPANTDRDGGLRVPADEGRASPVVQTDEGPGRPIDPLLDRIGDSPPKTTVMVDGKPELSPVYYRLTSRPQADGTVWSMHYGDANAGGIYRIRSAPLVEAVIESATGACAAAGQTQGNVTLTAADAGAGASYRWDVDGDGLPDSGRTARTTTITPSQIPTQGWVRLIVSRGSASSVAARFLCSGPPPDVKIVSPADGAKVVLGKPVVVSATRPAGDAAATGIPDSQLKWRATTVHGSSHEHPLAEQSPPFELVGGQQKMQITITPDPSHELGSYTRVRLLAPGTDGASVAQTITLLPKPVSVTLLSSPAGAKLSVKRDAGQSVVDHAPGNVDLAAGASTEISATLTWTDDAGVEWKFVRWSDGLTGAARGWTVPDNGGNSPTAEYRRATDPGPTTPETTPETTPATTPATTPTTTTPATTPATTPTTTPTPTSPTTPAPTTPNQTTAATTPGPTTTPTLTPVLPALLPPTALELRLATLSTSASATKKKTTVGASIKLGRSVTSDDTVAKVALRDSKCRWWVFSQARFARAAVRHSAGRRSCGDPPGWKQAQAKWTDDGVLEIQQSLAKRLPAGRYALRVKISRGGTVLADRLRSVTVG